MMDTFAPARPADAKPGAITDQTYVIAEARMLQRRREVEAICKQTGERPFDVATRLMAMPPKEKPVKGKRVSDKQVRDVWTRVIDGRADSGCIQLAADELDLKVNTLTGHLRRLGLAYPGGRVAAASAKAKAGVTSLATESTSGTAVNGRLPYERPTIKTVPLNGNDIYAEAGRQILADGKDLMAEAAAPAAPVGAQTPPAAITALLADMEALGAQVQVSGEINIRITFGEARP